MRILFLSESYPGREGIIAAAFAADPRNEVLFASSYSRLGFTLPGVKRVLLRVARASQTQDEGKGTFEQEWARALKVGKYTLASLQSLRETGFVPDIIINASARGHGFFLSQVFPEAFVVLYPDNYFFLPGADTVYSPRGKLCQSLQGACLMHSHAVFVFYFWQKLFFPASVRESIQVAPMFVDTDFFAPEAAKPLPAELGGQDGECVSFSVNSVEAARAKSIWAFVMLLLHRRPGTRVLLLSANDEVRQTLQGVADRLGGPETERLFVLPRLSLATYRDMLCASSAHINLGVAAVLERARLEIMSCGALLMAPSMPALEHIQKSGENMLVCRPGNAETQYQNLAALLDDGPRLARIRKAARETALAFRYQDVLPRHLEQIYTAYENWKQQPKVTMEAFNDPQGE